MNAMRLIQMLRSVFTVVAIGLSFMAAPRPAMAEDAAGLERGASLSALAIALGSAQSHEVVVIAGRPLAFQDEASAASRFAARPGPAVPDAAAFSFFDPRFSMFEPAQGLSFSFATPRFGDDFGFGIATRTAYLATDFGESRSRGAEVRFGQRLDGLVREFQTSGWDNPSWYFFAASDGQALTWTPAMERAMRPGLSYQDDRITIGDLQAGLSMEANGLQASFSYIQREISNGRASDTQNFTGVSLTMRR
jgi:hypothetical protein